MPLNDPNTNADKAEKALTEVARIGRPGGPMRRAATAGLTAITELKAQRDRAVANLRALTALTGDEAQYKADAAWADAEATIAALTSPEAP